MTTFFKKVSARFATELIFHSLIWEVLRRKSGIMGSTIAFSRKIWNTFCYKLLPSCFMPPRLFTDASNRTRLCDNVLDKSEFCKAFLKDDIHEEYQTLIRGLDPESVATVTTLINRVRQVFQTGDPRFILTLEEKNVLQKLLTEFFPRIIRISPSVWVYGNYTLPIWWFEPHVLFYRHHINCLRTLGKVKNKAVIDAGAFIGDSAILFSEYTDKNVYAFEPFKQNYELLGKTIALNPQCKNIIAVPYALGDETTTLMGKFIGAAATLATGEGRDEIHVVTLDDFVAEHHLEVGLIKVDVEGFEQRLLKGAEKTIKMQKPALFLSIYHSPDDFFHIKPLIESWNLGYIFKIIKSLDGQLFNETTLVAEVL